MPDPSKAIFTPLTVVGAVPYGLLLFFGVAVFFAMPWGLEQPTPLVPVIGALILLVAGSLAWSGRATRWMSRPVDDRMLAGVIAMGLVLRLVWVGLVPPVQESDMKDYIQLAASLLAGDGYQQRFSGMTVFTYRAPGFAFALAAVGLLVRNLDQAALVLNLLCYAATVALLLDTTKRLSAANEGRWCVLLLAIWPSSIMTTGLAFNESLSLMLLLAVGWSTIRARRSTSRWWFVATGLSLGLGALVRPSLLPLPVLLVVIACLDAPVRRHALRHAVLATFVAAACIVPWTVRNTLILHSVVVVSSNGGDNLYRANNPNGSGGFSARGEQDFSSLLPDEAAWNRANSDAAKAWITSHPLEFARVTLRRVALQMTADETGAYWSMKRAHGIVDLRYALAIVACNTWWMGLWIVMVATLARRPAALVRDPALVLLMAMAAVLPVVHSVFEAQPRYHMPMIGVFLCVLAAGARAANAAGTRAVGRD